MHVELFIFIYLFIFCLKEDQPLIFLICSSVFLDDVILRILNYVFFFETANVFLIMLKGIIGLCQLNCFGWKIILKCFCCFFA
jgi:hypothetical protein